MPSTLTPDQIDAWRRRYLPKFKRHGREWRGPCPVHKGKRDSFAINADTGQAFCHSECNRGWSLEEIHRALHGIPFTTGVTRMKKVEKAVYRYTDEKDKVLFEVVRFEEGTSKTFAQRHEQAGRPVWNLKGVRRVLYRLSKVLAAQEVFVVEGEKDVETLERWGLVATCNPGGAGKWSPDYTECLRGREVVILPDNDEPGQAHADKVAAELAGKARLVTVVNLPNLPDKGDVSDWAAAGGTTTKLRALVEAARGSGTAAEDVNELGQFRVTPAGIESLFQHRDNPKGHWQRICGPIDIVARTRTLEGTDWGTLVKFKTPEGHTREHVIPRSLLLGDSQDAIMALVALGFCPNRNRRHLDRFKDYLYYSTPKDTARVTSRIGWHHRTFVLPDACFGPGEQVRFFTLDPIDPKFKVAGSLANWKANVGRVCAGNSRLVLMVSAALAAPLLTPIGAEGAGLHLFGLSSLGKTTALHAGASVWGGGPRNGFLETWKSTGNGMEVKAALHNDALLPLDEISEVSAKEISEIVYALSNGRGKTRATKHITTRQTLEYRLLFVSTGEKQQQDLMAELGKPSKGGQEARMVQIAADAGEGMGIFETLHEFKTSLALQQHVSAAARRHYGSPIRAWLTAITKDIERAADQTKALRQAFVASQADEDSSGEVKRVASLFGLCAAAGELATKAGITGWRDGEATIAARLCFQGWLANRGGKGAFEVTDGIARVYSFLQTQRSRFLRDDAKNQPIPTNCAGVIDEDCAYFYRSVFAEEVLRGRNSQAVLDALSDRGLLRVTSNDYGHRHQLRKRLPPDNKLEWVYAVRLDSEDTETQVP